MQIRRSTFIVSALAFGYAFLYIPILSIIVFSFNESRLVTVWAGFSTKWYYELLHNDAILRAAWMSLRIAAMAATVSVIMGTLASIAIVRFQKLRGRSFFNGLVTAPLVMPDVIMGLALLMFFVTVEQWIGWPRGRGMTTITLAHITLGVAYVVIIVRERLLSFDNSLEEAALDLGAQPAVVFFRVTLPIISPSLVAGWLLSFTLSLDDVVIASFVSGAGSTTLPMVVFSSVRLGVNPQINALATIVVTIVSIGVILSGIILRRRERMQK